MAPHPFWKGYLKLSLVTCPVAMTPAVSEAEKIRFHLLNRKTGNRVESRMVDAVTGRTIKPEDEAKAYQQGDDDYLILEEDELDAVALESNRTIDIDSFVPAHSIGWIWYDTPHYLRPDDPVGAEAFAVIRTAMAAAGMAGLARLVLHRRERAVMLVPRGRGIVLWTLRYGDEVRPAESDLEDQRPEKPAADSLALIAKLIKQRMAEWDPKLLSDPMQDQLAALIAAKQRGKRPAKRAAKPEAPTSKVVNIMDALRRSLAAETKRGKAS